MLGQDSPHVGAGQPPGGAGQSPYWGREIIREWPTFVAVLPHVCGFLQPIGRDALGPTNLLGYKTLLGHTSPVSPFRYPSLTTYAGRFGAVETYVTPSPQFTPAWPRDTLDLIPSHTYFCLVFCTAELLAGIWTMKYTITDPCLAKNAASLPFLLQSSWAEGTNAKYRRGWSGWFAWCGTYSEATPCPAYPFYVALYFNDIVISKRTLGHLQTAHSGIRWGHMNATDSPTDHPFIKVAFAGAKRLLAVTRQPTRKEPFTLLMFDDAYSLYGTSQNLIHMIFLLVCLLGFSGFLRIDELLAIQIKDISFQPDHMEITIP